MSTSDREVARHTEAWRLVRTWQGVAFADEHPMFVEAITAALTTARREQAERDAQLAESANLPHGYLWGRNAMESFNFGKERAAAAIRAGAKEGK